MKRTKILQVHAKMNRGGVESLLMNTLRYIDRDSFSFVFLCSEGGKYDYEEELIELGAKIIRTPKLKDIGIIKYLKIVRQIMYDEDIDIVHAHSNMALAFLAAKFAGVRLRIAHSHTTGTETTTSPSRKMRNAISKILINSLSTDRVACGRDAGRYLFGNKPFEIIHNGIMLDDFYFSKDSRSEIRSGYDIPESAMVLGHIGRMVPVKNQKFIIEVFAQYLRLVPDAYLFLIGDGEQKIENELHAKKYKVFDRVKFLGSRGDTGSLYSAMDLFVFPSHNEGLGMVLIEAQTNGLKSLASDSVPEDAKLTDGVEFYPLANGAKSWALKIDSMNLTRFDAQETLRQSTYNIAVGVKDIEKLYREMQVRW